MALPKYELATGYLFNSGIDTRNLEAVSSPTTKLSDPQVDGNHDEASLFCLGILFLPVPRLHPTKPLQLRPLRAFAFFFTTFKIKKAKRSLRFI